MATAQRWHGLRWFDRLPLAFQGASIGLRTLSEVACTWAGGPRCKGHGRPTAPQGSKPTMYLGAPGGHGSLNGFL